MRNMGIAIILACALGLRLYYIFSNDFPPPVGDAMYYSRMAEQFLETGVLGYNHAGPNAYVMPGMPILLSSVYYLFGTSMLGFQLLQVAFSVLTVWVGYRIAAKYASVPFSLLAAACMAFYPSFIYANGLLLTEVSFTLLLASFLLVLLQGLESGNKLTLIGAGLLLGASIYIRPTPAIVILPLIVYFSFTVPSRKIVIRALVYVGLSSLIVMLPWWIRNFLLYDRPVLFSTSGSNPLLWGMHPYYIGVLDTFDAIYKVKPDEGTINELWTAKAKDMFREQIGQPAFIKWLIVGKLNYFWKLPWVENGEIAHLFEKIRNPLHLVLVIGGWLGVCVGVVRRHPIGWMALLIVAYTLVHQAMLTIPRYAFPIMPYMIIMFCYGLNVLYDAVKKRVRE